MGGFGVSQNLELARQWFEKAAAQGDSLAQSMLPRVDNMRDAASSPEAMAKNIGFIQKSAQDGNAVAQFQLSLLLATGDGVAKDEAQALVWERKAAEQDHPQALAALATRLILGGGVKPDFWKGYSYLYRASALGHTLAQRMMGSLYKTGTGVKPDPVDAVKWFNIAVHSGDTRAAQLRDEVAANMKPSDLAEAQRRTDAWLKKSPRERLNP